MTVSDAGYRIPADPRLLAIAFECMAHGILLLCTGEMSKLRIAVEGARVRPIMPNINTRKTFVGGHGENS